jgi:deoxyribose-phosphate aldolase
MADLQLRASGSRILIPRVPVDMVGANERADSFTKRSIKNESKLSALYAALTMLDLTTLEGADTPGKVRQLCSKAVHPVPAFLLDEMAKHKDMPPIPSVAAVCVYPNLVPYAKEYLGNSGVKVAAVSTAFPSGQAPEDVKMLDVKRAVQLGADEIDMVIDRGAFLSGRYQKVFDEIVKVKEICGDNAHLKVILETGELKTYDHVRLASDMAMEAGADFIKTSTGKVQPAATLPVTLVMLQAIADYHERTGRMVGMKPAGGIRTAKQAIHYLCMVNETLGSQWLDPDWFRFGASVLLNDILRQIFKQATGRYFYDKAFSTD